MDERRVIDRFNFLAEDAKRHFGQWDPLDPVALQIIIVVQAQNDLMNAIEVDVNYTLSPEAVTAAYAERRAAIEKLWKIRDARPEEEEDL